jgi:thioredoxin 1
MIQEISSSDFENILNEPSKMVLIDFYMPYGCAACDILYKVLADYSEKNNHDHLLYKIDASNEKNTSLCLKFGIRQVPTLLLFKNGKVIDKSIGKITLDELIEFIEKHRNK